MWPEAHVKPYRKQKNNVARRDKFKAELFALDQRCRYCCRTLISADFGTIDHIIPRTKGGGNEKSNKTLCCVPCNREKANSMPTGRWAPKFLP